MPYKMVETLALTPALSPEERVNPSPVPGNVMRWSWQERLRAISRRTNATPALSLAHRMGEGGRRPGEGTRLGRGEGELSNTLQCHRFRRHVAPKSDGGGSPTASRSLQTPGRREAFGVRVASTPLLDRARNSAQSRQDAKTQRTSGFALRLCAFAPLRYHLSGPTENP